MIRIKFFALFRDEVGKAGMEVEKGDIQTLGELMEKIKGEVPSLDNILKDGNAIFALNQEIVEPDARIKDGDEIAIFPPVSGG